MRDRNLGSAVCLAAVALLALACDPDRQRVDDDPDAGAADVGPVPGGCSSTCAGCCTEDGTCLEGRAPGACGLDGRRCADCGPDGLCDPAGHCAPGSPKGGDGCEAPVAVTLSGGRATVNASLDPGAHGDSVRASCAAQGALDRVFRAVLPSAGRLLVRVRPGDGLVPTVSVRRTCDRGDTEVACRVGTAGGPLEVVVADAPAGPVFVWVESMTPGPFSLELEHTPAELVPCENATRLTLVSGRASLSGAFTSRSPEVPACPSTRPGVRYEVETTQPGTLSVSADSRANKFITVDLSRDCSGATQLGCATGSSGVEAVVRLPDSQPGRYVIAVAGETIYSAPGHEFDLAVALEPTPPNHTCAAATPIAFAGGRATLSGTTAGAGNDHFSFCLNYAGSEGQDAFYRFDLAEPRGLKARVTPGSAGSKPTLALRRGACNGTEIDCGLPRGGASEIVRQALAPGRYYLVVDSQKDGAGPFELVVELGDAALGESCSAAQPLVFTTGGDGKRTAVVTAQMRQYERDEVTRCNSYNINSTDVVYSFSTDAFFDFHAESIWRQGSDGVANLSLFRDDCTAQSEVACASEGVASTLTRLDVRGLPAGRYLLLMQSFSSYEVAPLELSVTLTPPVPGDGCGLPTLLAVPAGGGRVTASGDSAAFYNDAKGSCGGAGPDALFVFTTQAPMGLRAEATTPTTGFTPVLHLQSGLALCPKGAELACAAGASGKASLAKSVLPAGTYLLAVDSSTTRGGLFDLTLDFSPAAAGETCDAPVPLPFSQGLAGGTASATGSTVGLFDDVSSCGKGYRNPDRVYSFSIDRTLNLTASLDSTSGRTRPLLALRQSCGGTQATCGGAEWDQPSQMRVGSLAPGAWLLVADSDVSTNPPGFSYLLRATLAPPAPGDTCANPLPLAFSGGPAGGAAVVEGATPEFFDQGTPCGSAAPEVVYRFTTDRILNFTAKVEPAPGGTFAGGTLSLLPNCAARDSSTCGASPATGKAQIEAASLAPGTWLLVVDGNGAYRASANLVPPPPGDACHNALPLFPPGQNSGTVVHAGVAVGAFMHDLEPPCVSAGSRGRDLVYRFATSAPLNLRATAAVPGTTGYAPHLYVLPAGCGGAPAGCLSGSSKRTSILEIAPLAAGDWLLVLDSQGEYDMYRVPFDLTVALAPPASGDTCANPLPLPFPGGAQGGTVTVTGDTTDFFHYVDSTCAASGAATRGHDVLYSFATAAPTNLRVRLQSRTTGFRPSVFHAAPVSGACGYDHRLCAWIPTFQSWEMGDYGAMPAGTHYLVVDAPAGQAGAYELTAKLMPIVAGESCANPLPLPLKDGTARVTGEISDWFPDHAGSCQSMTSGEDVVYTFPTAQPRYVRARLSTTGLDSEFAPTVYLRSGACATGSDLGCQRGGYEREVTIAQEVASGNHFLFVDNGLRLHGKGAFTLEVLVGDRPQGDTCANPLPLTLSNGSAGGTARVTGDTSEFLADLTPSCGASTPSAAGRDLVYSFKTDRALNLQARLQHPSGNTVGAVVMLRSSCAGPDLACGVARFPADSTQSITSTGLAAGTYFLVVDNASSATGRTYTLDVTLAAP